MRSTFFIRVVLFLMALAPLILFAQDVSPLPEDPPCGPPFGPACIPIDGGISFLIAAGVALGGKKAYNLYRNNH